MSDVLQEIDVPLCPKCSAKHFPHEPCKKTAEDAVALCSLCVGNHETKDCPVLDPAKPWDQPELIMKKPAVASRRRRRRGRRR